jgi:hypothetical protein
MADADPRILQDVHPGTSYGPNRGQHPPDPDLFGP